MAIICGIAFLSVYGVPESLNEPLPDTIEDVELRVRKFKKRVENPKSG